MRFDVLGIVQRLAFVPSMTFIYIKITCDLWCIIAKTSELPC